jgi:phage-related protein
MGSSLDDLRDLPAAVREELGYAIYVVQRGHQPLNAKRLKGELAGLTEIVEDFDGDTYRAVYTVKPQGVVYVLHAFQKKSKRGIATPRRDVDLIKSRYAAAREHYAVRSDSMEDR